MNQQQAPIAMKETIEETLNQGKILTYEEFELTPEEVIVYKELKSGETLKKVLCSPIFIEKRFRNIHNNNVEMSLKFNVDGQYVTEKLPMESLLKLGSVLASKGFPISNPNLASVQEYLIKQQKTVSLQEQYQQVGVIKDSNGELMIALSEAISKNVTGLVWNKENSVADVSVGGSYDKWIETIEAEVLGEPQLEFMLAVAASAPIIGYYFQTRQDKDSLMLQLVGSSTTGKTTAAQLAISLFGPPIKGPKTLFQSFSGTENAIPRMLGGNYGVPFLLDELSRATSSDLTRLLYLFAESREKARLDEQSQFQEQSVWSTTIIMTGEHAILDQTNGNLGLQVRIFEFAIDAWTKDAAHANKLKKMVKNNYGHAGIIYADYLAEDWSRIDKNVQKWIVFFQQKMPFSKEMDRVGEKYAIIMAGLDMLGKATGVPFHLDDVAEFILQNEERRATRDSAEAFYQTVVQDVCASVTQFHFNNQMSDSPVVKGVITSPKTGSYYRVNYLKSAFSTLVQKQNISNETTLLTELKKKKYFVTESDRTTKRAIVDGQKVATYEFLIPISDLKQWLQ